MLTTNQDRYRIGKAHILITNGEDTKRRVEEAVKEDANAYVCVSNMRTVMQADKDPEYRSIMENSLFNIPDGTPLVWCARLWGLKQAQRSSGPDLFVDMLSDTSSGIKHFILGDTDETLALLKQMYNSGNIVGTYSPPFKPLDEYDFEGIAKMINDSGADIVWTSLRAPKQDILATRLLPYTENKLFIGVGAALRYAIGKTKLPNERLRHLGLSGLWMRNKRWSLVKWYLNTGTKLVGYMSGILVSRMRGKKHYE